VQFAGGAENLLPSGALTSAANEYGHYSSAMWDVEFQDNWSMVTCQAASNCDRVSD